MIVVDTNVVLRLMLGDDPAQLTAVRALLDRDRLLVPLTVLLEAGWVLESRYRLSRPVVADALADLARLNGIAVARVEMLDWALDRYRDGADWADMIHLVAAAKHGAFATFDRKLARAAGDQAPIAVETLA